MQRLLAFNNLDDDPKIKQVQFPIYLFFCHLLPWQLTYGYLIDMHQFRYYSQKMLAALIRYQIAITHHSLTEITLNSLSWKNLIENPIQF